MVSIFENTHSKIIVHILHDETLSDDNRQKFIRTAEKYSQGVDFVDITQYKSAINERLTKLSKVWTIGTLFRIFVPEAMSSLDKVLYLDCDLLVNLDIKELWDIDLESKSLAGAFDPVHYTKHKRSKLIVGSLDTYINAGVTVMNLRKIRDRGDFTDECIKWLIAHAGFRIFPDQDAINSIFLNDIKIVDDKFNVFADVHNPSQDLSGKIIHINGTEIKPWKCINGLPSDSLYWKLYLRTAWGKNTTREELIDTLNSLVRKSERFHNKPQDCIKSILSKVWKKFSNRYETLKIAILLKFRKV